jgi:hypothetical protein
LQFEITTGDNDKAKGTWNTNEKLKWSVL